MGYYSSTIQKGSQGSDVKKWQEYLNTQGYGLSVDGDFGTNTYNATIDYQTKNGLGVDGIVGANTWGKAGFTNINTPISAPTSSPLPTAPTYDSTSWDDTDKGKETAGAYDAAKDAVTNYGDFTWDKQGEYDALYDKYTNRDPFSYDFNADALYQQYKDMYMQQGKMAMQDAMGQAAAMTGGYGNSYAATVGNQAYQEHLGKLNEVIPELYQLAYSKYNQEGQDMLNAMGLMESDRAFDYGQYTDKYGRLTDAYGIASDDYYKGADMFYTEQGNKNSIAGQEFTDAMSIWNANNTNAWEQAKWNETQRLNELDRVAAITTGSGGSSGGGSGSGSKGGGSNVTLDESGNLKEGYTTTNAAYFDDDGNFKKATFSKYDDDGNAVWYIDGKTVVRQKGANPYTGTINPDLLNRKGKYDPDNAFSATPYQPNNINGKKLSKSGIKDFVNGVEQNVWKTPDGKLWIWDGTQNKYLSYTE